MGTIVGAEVGTVVSFPVSGTAAVAVGVTAVPQALRSIAAAIRTNMETDNFLFIFFSPFLFDNLKNAIGQTGQRNNQKKSDQDLQD
jgi:small basic protein